MAMKIATRTSCLFAVADMAEGFADVMGVPAAAAFSLGDDDGPA